MFKRIPNSDRSVRPFQVHKQWNLSGSLDTPSGSLPIEDLQDDHVFWRNVSRNQSQGGNFDPDTHEVFGYPLWNSLRKQYYTNEITQDQDGNTLFRYMGVDNLGDRRLRLSRVERRLLSEIIVINVPPHQFGEEILRESVNINVIPSGSIDPYNIFDDGYSNLYRDDQVHIAFILMDLETETFRFYDVEFDIYEGEINELDIPNNEITLTVNGDTATFRLISIDVGEEDYGDDFGIITLDELQPLSLGGVEFAPAPIGNVFYENGLIILNKNLSTSLLSEDDEIFSLEDFTLSYKSTVTIYEHEYFLEVNEDEFNISQNTSAIEIRGGDGIVYKQLKKYPDLDDDHEDQVIYNYTQIDGVPFVRQAFESQVSASVTGSFSDYEKFALTDPTGSYIAPFVTTIGLYDDNMNMLAVAKVTTPIKKLQDYPLNFIVRFDT